MSHLVLCPTNLPIQPNGDFVLRSRIFGWEVPEVELIGGVWVVVDRQCAGVALANVEVDVWDCCAIDGKLCTE